MRNIVWWRVVRWAVLAVLAVAAPQYLGEGDVNRLCEVIYISVAALGAGAADRLQRPDLAGARGVPGHGRLHDDDPHGGLRHVLRRWPASIAVAFTFVVGLVVGLPALRITGIYLALVTLALATLFPQIVVRLGDITGATVGRGLIPRDGYGDCRAARGDRPTQVPVHRRLPRTRLDRSGR